MCPSRPLALALLTLTLGGCSQDSDPLTPSDPGDPLIQQVTFPDPDPGPPIFARVTTQRNQIFSDGEYVGIPFYRNPDCVPHDINLLQGLFPPTDEGPGAFGCPMTGSGYYFIEEDAEPGTFPIVSVTQGPVFIWFVSWEAFSAASSDGELTMADLLEMDPLRGEADLFLEVLYPREANHRVELWSRGVLSDGRAFHFNVLHEVDRLSEIFIGIG